MEEFEKIYDEEMKSITPEDKKEVLLILDLWLSKGGKKRSLLRIVQDSFRFKMEKNAKEPQVKKGKKKKKKR